MGSEVHVYAAVDISLSMKGSKISEVCLSLSDIIKSCPDDVVFNVILFAGKSHKAVSARKSDIDLPNLVKQIKHELKSGTSTALYDAWGDMLASIPQSILSSSSVYIFVLTDGEDNSSNKYTLKSAEKLTQTLLQNQKTSFNFIQCGLGSNQNMLLSLRQICSLNSNQIQVKAYSDDAQGIKTALTSVKSDILLSTRSSGLTNQKSSKDKYKYYAVNSQFDLVTIPVKPGVPVPENNSHQIAGISETIKTFNLHGAASINSDNNVKAKYVGLDKTSTPKNDTVIKSFKLK